MTEESPHAARPEYWFNSRPLPAADAAVFACLLLGKLALSIAVVRAGFAQISDDDYARVVIAENFARSPTIDPSGTSWLPFPFWLQGTWLMVAGRSLAMAKAFGLAVGVLSPPLLFTAARRAGINAWVAGSAALAFALSPWCAWLACAPVPEIPTAVLASGGLVLLRGSRRHEQSVGAVAIGLACLSRYEPWAIALFAALAGARTIVLRREVPRQALLSLLPIAAPLMWMAWNWAAHGNALHFLHRVATFRRSIGEGGLSIVDSVFLYPRALCTETPEAAVCLALVAGVVAVRKGSASFRASFGVPLGAILAVLVFLAYGSVRDGAPTHHPVRALVVVLPLAFLAGADTLVRLAGRRPWLAPAFVGCVGAALLPTTLRGFPGTGETEVRGAQIERGLALRSQPSRRFVVAPCQYEHFAFIAAFGAPERVTIEAPSKRAISASCPDVREMR